MIFKDGIKDIVESYDYFLLDIWGVIHDGSNAYPGVVEAIKFLHNKNKKVIFLSNAPRRAFKVAEILQKFGITSDLYNGIITSGEATFLDLKKNQNNNFNKFGQNYFYIGPKKDMDLLEGLAYKRVENVAEAHFAITTGFDHDNSVLEEKLPQALSAKQHNLPMICVNPDLIVVKQNGHEMICAGALAKKFEELGGTVFYYGKPFFLVYKIICELFNIDNLSKMLAIGDGLETDIKGASDFGIDNVLITGGILANSLDIKYNQIADKSKLETICNNYQIFPKFVIPNFKL